jgi:hypothetical protein
MEKRALKKPSVARRYDTTPRSVDRMVEDKRLPPPDFYLGPIPFWYEKTLDENDRRAALRPVCKKAYTEKAEA